MCVFLVVRTPDCKLLSGQARVQALPLTDPCRPAEVLGIGRNNLLPRRNVCNLLDKIKEHILNIFVVNVKIRTYAKIIVDSGSFLWPKIAFNFDYSPLSVSFVLFIYNIQHCIITNLQSNTKLCIGLCPYYRAYT